jgi:hypothetical protein
MGLLLSVIEVENQSRWQSVRLMNATLQGKYAPPNEISRGKGDFPAARKTAQKKISADLRFAHGDVIVIGVFPGVTRRESVSIPTATFPPFFVGALWYGSKSESS